MRKLVLVLFAFVLALGSVFAEESLPYFELGDKVPDFTVELCDGSVFTLSEQLKTHDAVMINIWATWCSPCRMEFPYMESAYNKYKDSVAVVCLSPFDDNETITEFMTENGISNLPMGYDAVGLGDVLVSAGYPTTAIVDKFGNYAFYECGCLLDETLFTRVFDYFISDDYTQTTVITALPALKSDVESPENEVLTLAATDGSISLSCSLDEDVWPFLPYEGGIANSNTAVKTRAAFTASVSVNAGDVFKLDYEIAGTPFSGRLGVTVNGVETVQRTNGQAGTYVYEFDTAGEYAIEVYYSIVNQGSTEGAAFVSNIALLSGDAADSVLSSLTVYPKQLKGSEYELEIMGENVKEVVLDDPNGTVAAVYSVVPRFYVANDDFVTLGALIGDDIDAQSAFLYNDTDPEPQILASVYEGDGYFAVMTLDKLEDGSYCNNNAYLYKSISAEEYDYAVIFANEYNLNYFIEKAFGDEAITWKYSDSNLKTIYVRSEDGTGIEGAVINVCTDDTCTVMYTDANGAVSFEGTDECYYVHVLSVPEAYAADASSEYIFNDARLIITIGSAQK